MKTRKRKSETAPAISEAAPVIPAPEVAPESQPSGEIITQRELLKRLPVSRRTVNNWRDRGLIPTIQLGAKLLFHWPSVQAALLRHQRSGKTA